MTKLNQNFSKMTLGRFIKALFSKATPNYIKLIIGLALSYTVLPLDFLPDLLGPLGFADDAAIIGILTTIAMHLLDNYNRQEANKQKETVKIISDAQVIE